MSWCEPKHTCEQATQAEGAQGCSMDSKTRYVTCMHSPQCSHKKDAFLRTQAVS